MNYTRAFWRTGFASLLVGSVGALALAQGVPSRGRAIQFSDPKVELVTSNLNHSATTKKSSLRNLDDQFKAPFNFLDASDPANDSNLNRPMLRPPALNPRALRQLQDKQKEESQWIFGSPEELEARRLSAERLFGVTEFDENGMVKTDDESPLQRYWDQSDRDRASQTNRMGSEVSSEKTDQEIKDQARAMFGVPRLPLPAGMDQPVASRSSLTPAYGGSFLPDVNPMKSSSESFAAPAASFTVQKNEEAVSRMNTFKQMFDIKSPNLGGTMSAPAPTFSRPGSSADFAVTPGATLRPAAAPVSGFNPLPGSSFSKPLGSAPAATFTPPPITQTPRAKVPPTGFQLPSRSF